MLLRELHRPTWMAKLAVHVGRCSSRNKLRQLNAAGAPAQWAMGNAQGARQGDMRWEKGHINHNSLKKIMYMRRYAST